ncbi:hypothetical protein [Streptomyces sp. NBC_01565]|uniref:hypothetical protein n=1 Tax=unclassified Streptomyces TaxID=2593676 RepID=UPI00225970C4|nr:hypothetical protein [Streptomyces sp. NBC_01565]MCX4539065.1 hypothetical protein [Streptomyces sp. NBC_01565]
MGLAAVLLTAGLVALIAGAAVALNIRGCARALERRGTRNMELAMQARGDLGQPQQVMSALVFRFLGTAVALGGVVLALGGLLEMA